MNRAALLGGTALVAALAFSPAIAGSVGTGDSMEVSLFGEVRFQINHTDQDDRSDNKRGFQFVTDEAELGIEARNTADNGILYGVEIVMNVNVDDTTNGDKVFAFIDSDNFGRFQLGDNDNAADSLFVDGADVLAARNGYDGEVSDVFNFGGSWIGVGTDNVGKSTKIVYFTPNIAGFTLGASFTPDSGGVGASFGEVDNNGSFENVIDIAANYVGNFGDVEVVVAGFGEFGDNEDPDIGKAETYGVGATIGFSGFTVGAGYTTFNEAGISSSDKALGVDAGQWWDVGVGYRTGPWGVSVGYYEATLGNAAGTSDSKNTVLTFDADYEVAPGWVLAGSLSFNEAENRGDRGSAVQGDDNSGHSAIIYNIWAF
jgi:outer membrane protein OmpU